MIQLQGTTDYVFTAFYCRLYRIFFQKKKNIIEHMLFSKRNNYIWEEIIIEETTIFVEKHLYRNISI